MFYSETLLSKTGPLARVWLSANLERKLSKTQILQQNVKDSVDTIVNPNAAPIALRLSGQLLLGVVRIYSRKARYLLDDCNEALMKIKMAFRLSGNNDIPEGLHMPSRDTLMLQDVLTEGDNLEMPPMPDASFLLSQIDDETAQPSRKRRAGSRDINLQEDFSNSQFLQNSVDKRGYRDEELVLDPDDIDLGLDLGLDIPDDLGFGERSVEIGRTAPKPREFEDDMFSQSDLNTRAKDGMTGGDRENSVMVSIADDDGFRGMDDDGDINMMGPDITYGIGDQSDAPALGAALAIGRERISESPLSDIDPNLEQEIAAEHQRNLDTTFEADEEPEESIHRNPAQRARKLKPIQVDNQEGGTMLSKETIRAQQQDHSKILRPQTSLPRDPILMALMEMQKNGGFVSNIMADGRSSGWAPELRGLLSLDAVRNTGDLKRKRDSGIADMDDHGLKSPRLEIDDDEDIALVSNAGGLGRDDTLVAADGTIMELPDDGGFNIVNADDEDEGFDGSRPQSRDGGGATTPAPNFDETTAPLVHPADSGPVSLGTKHAVHLLRECFGGAEGGESAERRKKTTVVFQDLLPAATTSKADATKMFFEVLVLATKDAVKVEQQETALGGAIRIRGKRGLWGSWAEREAGGEIEEEAAAAAAEENVAGSARLANGGAIAVAV